MRKDVRIHFHKLNAHRRLDDYVLGHEPSGAYLSVDEEGKRVVEHLKAHTVQETEKHFPEYDVKHIIEQLREAGLIHKIGHRVVTEHRHIVDLLGINPKQTGWVRHPATKGTILGVIATGFALMLTDPALLPSPNWFYVAWPGALLPLAFLLFWALQFTHELGHYLVMKSTGHATGFSVVNKWHLLLPHADISNARLLEPSKAVQVHLAGIVSDLLMLSISAIMLTIGVWEPLFRLIALFIMLELLVQLAPVRKSDLSRAIEHAMGINSLSGTLKKAAKRLCVFCKTKEELLPNEQRVATQWLPLVAVGVFTLGIAVVGYVIPIAWRVITFSIGILLKGARYNESILFLDGVIALLFILVFIALYSISLLRHHRLAEHSVFEWFLISLFLLANYCGVFLLSFALMLYANALMSVLLLIMVGAVFGILLDRLLGHIRIEMAGLAPESFITAFAVVTAVLLILMGGWAQSVSGTIQPVTLHAIAYGTGMVGSTVL